MKWVEAVKVWNHGKRNVNTAHGWFVPRKGTSEYDEVKKIQMMEKNADHEKILSVKSESTMKKQARKQAKKEKKPEGEAVVKPKRVRKVKEKEKKEEPKGMSEVERKVEEGKYEGMNKDRRAKALEQLKSFEKQIKESNLEKAKKAEAMEKVAKAKEAIEMSVKSIREAKGRGGFRGQIIQKQRSKYTTLLDSIDFFLFDTNSPLRNKQVLKEFGADFQKKKRLNDRFRIFLNLDKVTKDKVILDRKEKIMERVKSEKRFIPKIKDVENKEFLEMSLKDTFGGDKPKKMVEEKKEEPKMEEKKEEPKMEEKKEEPKMEEKKEEPVKEESSSDEEEDDLKSKEKRLAKLKERYSYWETSMKGKEVNKGMKSDQAKLKKQIKALENEIAEMKKDQTPKVMKVDLPPPSEKKDDSKKDMKEEVESEIENVFSNDNENLARDTLAKIGKAEYYASKKIKDIGQKNAKANVKGIVLIMEMKRPENLQKLKEKNDKLHEILDTLVIDKSWVEYLKKL
jgi:hypothetical protein